MSSLSAALIKAILHFCAILPLSWARALGRGLAFLYWPVKSRNRKVTERNIQLAFPELSPSEQRRLAKQSMTATMELFTEMGHIWLRPWPQVNALIKSVEGEQQIVDSLKRGRGVIILAPHLGNWEVTGLHLATLGDTVSLYEPPNMSQLGTMMETARQRSGATLVPTDARGLATLLKSVKRGKISGILPDQAPEDINSGANVPFMGIECFTGTLASNMIRRTGALAVFAFAMRVPGGFKLFYEAAEDDIYSEDMEQSLAAVNRGVERCVRQCIEQYQWEYKRFRVRPRQGPGHYDDL